MIIASPVEEVLVTFLRRFRANRIPETDPVSYTELFIEIGKYNKERSYDVLCNPKNETARKALDDCCCNVFNNHYVYTKEEPDYEYILHGRWTPSEVCKWADNVVDVPDPQLIY